MLYWDKIDYPERGIQQGNSVLWIGVNLEGLPEMRLLIDEGILEIKQILISRELIPTNVQSLLDSRISNMTTNCGIAHIGQLELAKQSLKNGEIASIAQIGNHLSFPSDIKSQKSFWEFSLYESLPIPSEDVPVEERLKFKVKRSAKLLCFRDVLEDARKTILASDEPQHDVLLFKENIERSLLDLKRVLEEGKIKYFFETLNMYLKPSSHALTASAIAAVASQGVSIPLEIGVSAGMGVSTLIKFSNRLIQGEDRVPEKLKNYLYLYQAKKKGII